MDHLLLRFVSALEDVLELRARLRGEVAPGTAGMYRAELAHATREMEEAWREVCPAARPQRAAPSRERQAVSSSAS